MKGSDTVVQIASSEFRVDLKTDDVLRSRGDAFVDTNALLGATSIKVLDGLFERTFRVESFDKEYDMDGVTVVALHLYTDTGLVVVDKVRFDSIEGTCSHC